jgi:cell division protein ZapA
MAEITTVTISIADKKYQLKCPAAESEKLKEAGVYLDMKMRDVQEAGNAVGFERTAMMAALNVCYELMTIRAEKSTYGDEVKQRLQALSDKIAHLLDENHIDLQTRTVGEQTQLEI